MPSRRERRIKPCLFVLYRHLCCCASSVRCRVSWRFAHAMTFITHPLVQQRCVMDRVFGDHRPAALFSSCGMHWAVVALG